MKKRLLALLLAAVMLTALLAGCGSSSSDSSSSSSSSSSSDTEETETAEETEEAAETEQTETDDDEAAEEAAAEEETTTDEASDASDSADVTADTDDVVDATDPDNPYGLSDETLEMIDRVHEMEAEYIAEGVMPGPEKTYDADGNEVSIKGVTYDYPIEDADGVELEIWACLNGNLTNWIEGYGDLRAWEYVQEETGVALTFVSVSEETVTDQFSLMVASGDYSDILFLPQSSSAFTPSSLYNQEVIISMDDYMDEYMPNYSAWLASDADYDKQTKDDNGNHLGTYLLNMESIVETGSWIRTDLLEKYGMDTPETLDEFEAFFEACKNDGLEQVIGVSQDSLLTVQAGAWDIAGLSDLALFQVDGVVKSSYLEDAAYDYVAKLAEWYEKGYFDADVMSITGSPNDSIFTSSIYSGNMALFESGSNTYSDFIENAEVDGFALAGIGSIVMESGQTTHFMEPIKVKTATAICVSTDCDEPEIACRLLDWFYTDDGINTANYGAEGLTWYWDSDGNRQYTELIWNDTEFGIIPANIIGIYALQGRFAFVQDPMAIMPFQTVTSLEAIQAWVASMDSDYYLLTGILSLTDDEQQIVNDYTNDISTYAEESLTKVVVGNTELTEEWWDDFVETLKDMGLEEVLEQYQSAYDRYLAR